MDTPTLYAAANAYPSATVADVNRAANAQLVFVTDRSPAEDGTYGSGRSQSVAFGYANVAIGRRGTSWDDLVAVSSGATNAARPRLELAGIAEHRRFPPTPLPFAIEAGRPVDLPGPSAAYGKAQAALRGLIVARLSQAGSRQAVLLIHGVNTDFESGALSLSEVWHFSGRIGVPILYSWPSGRGGLFGYFTDRESGEFTVFHLKELLRLLGSMPELDAVHIIAHSRGTDVATTALRELVIEARAGGRDPRKSLKIENLILAAPDLDFGVVGQRLIAERFGPAIGQITIYTNRSDDALRLSQRLMAGVRFGRLQAGELSAAETEIFRNVRNVHFVSVPNASGAFGHSYYREDPRVLSDVVLLIRTGASPGSIERPLTRIGDNFWAIHPTYPSRRAHSAGTEALP